MSDYWQREMDEQLMHLEEYKFRVHYEYEDQLQQYIEEEYQKYIEKQKEIFKYITVI
jgi:hypothetical protein